MRTAKISSYSTIKINTGNYEILEVSKSIETEVTYEKPEELSAKSVALDKMLAAMLREEAEYMMKNLGRKRIVKAGGREVEAGLWDIV